MEQKDLSALYITRLQQYEKDFKREVIAPFKAIKIHNNPEGFNWESLGLKGGNYYLKMNHAYYPGG
jgi:hypothetical protein